MTHPLLVVDAANVVGSVPDGWWRDRAGATARLRDDLVKVAEHGLRTLPGPLDVVLVVEGKARHVESVPGVRVVAAPASGDDTIVDVVHANPPDHLCTVITADRALRHRVEALGATVLGPRTVRRPR
ncbi:NTP pyrophosphohydrolase [Actinosynnema sp. NPDC051121]|nr:NTP pyrophosphohydrolase [Saccharothrix sp.]